MIVTSATPPGATVRLPAPEPVDGARMPVPGCEANEKAGATGVVVTTFWKVTLATSWSGTAVGAPVMSGLPMAIDSRAVSGRPPAGSVMV